MKRVAEEPGLQKGGERPRPSRVSAVAPVGRAGMGRSERRLQDVEEGLGGGWGLFWMFSFRGGCPGPEMRVR